MGTEDMNCILDPRIRRGESPFLSKAATSFLSPLFAIHQTLRQPDFDIEKCE